MLPREFQSQVLEEKELNPSVKYVKLSVPPGFSFKPGQYVSLRFFREGKRVSNPYSIVNVPGKSYIELCIKRIENGVGSNYVWNLKQGDDVELFGPAGKFLINEDSLNKDLVFISAGTGISAFVSMIPWLLEKGFDKKIILIKGFRNEEDVLYEKEFSELKEKYDNFEFHNVLSSSQGYVQDSLDDYVPNDFNGDVYICGLSDMIDSVKEKLKERGISEDRMFFEKYD